MQSSRQHQGLQAFTLPRWLSQQDLTATQYFIVVAGKIGETQSAVYWPTSMSKYHRAYHLVYGCVTREEQKSMNTNMVCIYMLLGQQEPL